MPRPLCRETRPAGPTPDPSKQAAAEVQYKVVGTGHMFLMVCFSKPRCQFWGALLCLAGLKQPPPARNKAGKQRVLGTQPAFRRLLVHVLTIALSAAQCIPRPYHHVTGALTCERFGGVCVAKFAIVDSMACRAFHP